MADVTGQFGDQEVVLNNAATEATLKQLLQSMNALAAKQGVKIKNDAEAIKPTVMVLRVGYRVIFLTASREIEWQSKDTSKIFAFGARDKNK